MNLLRILLVTLVCSLGCRATSFAASAANPLVGAWGISGSPEHVLLVTSDYWSRTTFDREQRQFGQTFGGTYSLKDGRAEGVIQFHSSDKSQVGSHFAAQVKVGQKELEIILDDGNVERWTRIDDATTPLAGAWRITGRHADGKFSEMPLRARRTLKLLSGTRFQWIAINIETGEFSGTGGGTYTYESGKYVEKIEFFSRDNTRVGARLEFDGKVEGDNWDHRGLSSKGDPIHEVWSRFLSANPR